MDWYSGNNWTGSFLEWTATGLDWIGSFLDWIGTLFFFFFKILTLRF